MQHNVHIIISPVIKFNSKCHDIKSVETNFKYVISNVLIYLSENCLALYKVIIILPNYQCQIRSLRWTLETMKKISNEFLSRASKEAV